MENTKKPWLSLGANSNGIGILINAIVLGLSIFGVVEISPEETEAFTTSLVTLLVALSNTITHVLGFWGRWRANSKISL